MSADTTVSDHEGGGISGCDFMGTGVYRVCCLSYCVRAYTEPLYGHRKEQEGALFDVGKGRLGLHEPYDGQNGWSRCYRSIGDYSSLLETLVLWESSDDSG